VEEINQVSALFAEVADEFAQNPRRSITQPVHVGGLAHTRQTRTVFPNPGGHFDRPQSRPIHRVGRAFRANQTQARLAPANRFVFARIRRARFGLHNGNHASIHLRDGPGGAGLRFGALSHDADGLAVTQCPGARGAGRHINAIVFAHTPGRRSEGILRAKINQGALQAP
jgi:hypothetical protein